MSAYYYVLLLCLSSLLALPLGTNGFDANEALHRAALDVIEQHQPDNQLTTGFAALQEDDLDSEDEDYSNRRSKRSLFNDIPQLQLSPYFMHGFIAETGVGNREELLIDKIQEERLATQLTSPILGWNYMRFNSTDFVMAYQLHHITVWKMRLNRDNQNFVFDRQSAFCQVDTRTDERVLQHKKLTIFFSRLIGSAEVLFFASYIKTPKNFELRVYRVVPWKCALELNFIDNREPIKIGFVRSQFNSALVVLVAGDEPVTRIEISAPQEQSVKIVKVYAFHPVDLETFTINGYGYIAVATLAGCQVFRLNEFIETYSRIYDDNLVKLGINNIKSFRLGFNYYLGLATNGNRQFLYQWTGNSFELKQTFDINAVIQWTTIDIATCRDDVLLVFLRSTPTASVFIYLWNGQTNQFLLATDNKNAPFNFAVVPFSQSTFSFHHTGYLLQVDAVGRSHLISIKTRLGVVPDPILQSGQKISEIMHMLKDRFLMQQSVIQSISESVRFAVRPKKTNLFNARQHFNSLQVLNSILTQKLNKFNNIFWENSPITMKDFDYKIFDLQKDVESVKIQLNQFERALMDVVYRNQIAQITGHKKFLGQIQVPSLNTKSIYTIKSIDQVLRNLYRLNKPLIKIRGKKQFVKPTIIRGSVNSNFINRMKLEKEVVISNIPQVISAPLQFNSALEVVHDLTVVGKLNHIKLPNDLIFLNNSNIITAPKIFTGTISIDNGLVSGKIDGVDLKQLVRTALFTSGNHHLKSPLTFTKPLVTNSITVDRHVNNFNLSHLIHSLVFKNQPISIVGLKTFRFQDVFVKNNLKVERQINGHLIPGELFLTNQPQVISASKHFKGPVRFENEVKVIGLVNGFKFPNDIATLTKNETFVGPVIFKDGISIEKEILIKGLVDGVDISRLDFLKINDNKILGSARFSNRIKVKNLIASGLINDLNLKNVYQDAIFKGTSAARILGRKNFIAPVNIQHLFVNKINGHDLVDFVTTKKNETIFGKKVFTGANSFKALGVFGLIDKVNITQFYGERIILSQHENIFGRRNFINQLVVDSMDVKGLLGGVLPLDLVVKSRPQIITGPKIFNRNLRTNNLLLKKFSLFKGKVDNIWIGNLLRNRIQLNDNHLLSSKLILVNCNVSFINVLGDVNNINLNQFASNIMLSSKPQTIAVSKTFKGNQFYSEIIALRGVNGIPLEFINSNAFHLHGSNQIAGQFKFEGDVYIDLAMTTKTINNINLAHLLQDSVLKTGVNNFKGHNIFKFGFNVQNDISAHLVNGINLNNEVLTKNRNHLIKGNAIFINDLHVLASVFVNGRVNGIDLSKFERKVVKTNRFNQITGNLEFTDPVIVTSNLMVSGRVNNLNLSQLITNSIYKSGNQTVFGSKVIRSPVTFLRNLNANRINGMDLNRWFNDIILVDNPLVQHVFSDKIFNGQVNVMGNVNQMNGKIIIKNTINEVNLENLVLNSIKVTESASLRDVQIFKNSAKIIGQTTILGRINGIDVRSDVVLNNFDLPNNRGNQIIFGAKTFNNMYLEEKAIVNGLVNGLLINSIYGNSLRIHDNQAIVGSKILRTLSLSNENNKVGLLNRMKFPEDFVILTTDQVITGNLLFNNSLVVNQNLQVNGLTNGINLSRLFEESMFKDMPQTIVSPIVINSAVFRKDVRVDGHVDNVDLSKLSNDARHFLGIVNISKSLMRDTVNRHQQVANYLFDVLTKSIYEINRFVLYKILDGVYGNRIDINGPEVFSIVETNQQSMTVHSLRFDLKTNDFDPRIETRQLLLIEKKLFYLSNQQFVIHRLANGLTQVFKNNQIIGELGVLIKEVEIQVIGHEKIAFLLSLGQEGNLNVHTIRQDNQTVFAFLGQLKTGHESSKIKPFLMNGMIYLAVGRFQTDCATENFGSLIYAWQNPNDFRLIQRIPLFKVVDIVHFQDYSKHYLAFADVSKFYESKSRQSIYIYRNEAAPGFCRFLLFQKLEFESATKLVAFSLASNIQQQYLAAVNKTQVMIWKQKGESGFVDEWSLPTGNSKSVAPVFVGGQLFLIVTQQKSCHGSLIFKAEMNGASLLPVVFSYD